MRMMRRNLVYLEIYGLALLLLAAGWDVFRVQPIRDIAIGANFYKIVTRLDYTWEPLVQVGLSVQGEPTLPIDFNERTGRWTNCLN